MPASAPPHPARPAGRRRRAIGSPQALLAALVLVAALATVGCGGQPDRPGASSPRADASSARVLPPLDPAARVPVGVSRRYLEAAARGDVRLACRLVAPPAVRRMVAIARNADYPVTRNPGCSRALSALRGAIGSRYLWMLARGIRTARPHVRGSALRASFRVAGLTSPQRVELHRVRGTWQLTRVPGAWAEHPVRESSGGSATPPA